MRSCLGLKCPHIECMIRTQQQQRQQRQSCQSPVSPCSVGNSDPSQCTRCPRVVDSLLGEFQRSWESVWAYAFARRAEAAVGAGTKSNRETGLKLELVLCWRHQRRLQGSGAEGRRQRQDEVERTRKLIEFKFSQRFALFL